MPTIIEEFIPRPLDKVARDEFDYFIVQGVSTIEQAKKLISDHKPATVRTNVLIDRCKLISEYHKNKKYKMDETYLEHVSGTVPKQMLDLVRLAEEDSVSNMEEVLRGNVI